MQLPQYPRYEEYADSGFDWIRSVPSHWTVSKLGSCLAPVSKKNHGDKPLLSITREAGVIERDVEDQDSNHNFIPDDLSNYKLVLEGQFAMNKMKAWQGSYGVSDHTGIVSPAYYVFDFAKPFDPRFFNIAIRSKLYVSYFGSASDGVRIGQWDLNKMRMKAIPFLVPPLEEQQAIARFLDDKIDKIDRAVKIKEGQIALLRERKQIIIQEAVTKGLNPDAPMKDSGIDWIGEIPAHWEVRRFKFLCKITTGERNTEDKQDEGMYPFFVRSQTPELINSYSFDGEAVLTAGDGAGVGKIYHYINGKFDFHQRVYKFSDFRHVLGKYVYHYLWANFFNVALLGTAKSTVDSLRLPVIQDFWFSFPKSFKEQEEILEHIGNESAKLDSAIELKECQIEALKEYKATLINAAVTGKIKVI